MSVTERLGQYIKASGKSVLSIERAINKRGTIQSALDNNSNLGSIWVSKILVTNPELSAEWLLRGEGQMIRVKDERKQLADYSVKEIVDYIIDFEDLFLKDRQFIELIDRLSEKGYRKEIEDEVRRIKEQIRKLGGSI